MVKKVTGIDFTVVETERRAGDPPILIASSEKAQKELNWKSENADLEKIIIDAWKWHQKACLLIKEKENI
jgi:UDP-glucose 4-epimerase